MAADNKRRASTRPKRTAGRPTKLTKQRANQIVGALKDGAYREQAALAAGIAPATFYRWMQEADTDEDAGRRTARREFRDAVVRAEAEAETEALAALRVGMKGNDRQPGDWRAAEAYLRAKSPERWSQHRDLTKLMERRLELEERMQERLALAFEGAIAALLAAGVAVTAEQRARAVASYVAGLEGLEAPDEPRQLAAGV